MSHIWDQTAKNCQNYDYWLIKQQSVPRVTPQMLNWKIKNLRQENFEGEANTEQAIGWRGYSTKQLE